ncbi:ankyrin repeat-containing domain protein [Aspergillus varians]
MEQTSGSFSLIPEEPPEMELSDTSKGGSLILPDWSFHVWWLILFISSYLVHSARALLSTNAQDCTQLSQSGLFATRWPIDVLQHFVLISVVPTLLHLLVLAILVRVLLFQFELHSKLVHEVSEIPTDREWVDKQEKRFGGEEDQGLAPEPHQELLGTPRPDGIYSKHIGSFADKREPDDGASDPGYVSQDQGSEDSQKISQDSTTAGGGGTQTNHGTQSLSEDSGLQRILIDDSYFSLLEEKVKLAVDRDTPGRDQAIFVAFFAYECRPRVIIQLFGYAIFKGKICVLKAIVKWKEERRGELERFAHYEMCKFVTFAIEHQYYDILSIIHHYFRFPTEQTIRTFGKFSVLHGSFPRVNLVWQHLKQNRLIMEHHHVNVERNEKLFLFLKGCVEEGLNENEDNLEAAICQRDLGMVRYWLQKVCNPRGQPGWTFKVPPLTLAACQGDVEIMNMILDKDAKINGRQNIMPGLVETALSERNNDIVKLLVARGASLYEVSLDAAVGNRGEIGLVRYLLHSGRRDFASPLYGTVLQKACAMGNMEIAQVLLDYNHDINPQSPMVRSGNGPLMGAIIGGNTELVKLLISKGASVARAQSVFGTALQTAIFLWDQLDMVQVLLDYTPVVDTFILPYVIMCKYSIPTPLALAMEKENQELERVLIERGASRAFLHEAYRPSLQQALRSLR